MVVSPHVYPPTITHAATGFAGTTLFNRLTVAHGYLTKQVSGPNTQWVQRLGVLLTGHVKNCPEAEQVAMLLQGFCNGNDCQTFIVVPGEFGSRMIDPRDLQAGIVPFVSAPLVFHAKLIIPFVSRFMMQTANPMSVRN